MEKFESHLTNSKLSKGSISSYKSYLNNAIRHLGYKTSEDFVKIASYKKLQKEKDRLQEIKSFIKQPQKTKDNVNSAFTKYIDFIKATSELKKNATKYSIELNESLLEVTSKSTNEKATVKKIIKMLSKLTERGAKIEDWDKKICNYLNVESPQELDEIYKTIISTYSGKYLEVVEKEQSGWLPKVIGIKSHISFLHFVYSELKKKHE